jgi:hypothetical protein
VGVFSVDDYLECLAEQLDSVVALFLRESLNEQAAIQMTAVG